MSVTRREMFSLLPAAFFPELLASAATAAQDSSMPSSATSVRTSNIAEMRIGSLVQRQQLGRKVQGCAAALLPFEADGRVAVKAFQTHLLTTPRAGLMNAVNMDTGYV